MKRIRSFGAWDTTRRVFAVGVSDVEAFGYGADGIEVGVCRCWWLTGWVVVSHVATSLMCLFVRFVKLMIRS
jgi:hypothetical protein